MWSTVLFVMVTSHAAYAGAVECAPYEHFDQCPPVCNEFCPTKDSQFDYCSSDGCSAPKCVCDFGRRRAANGTCIQITECPPFDCPNPNERYDPCPSFCPTDDCSQATPTGICPIPIRVLLVLECAPACRCKPTYWRKDGACVPYQQCDKTAAIVFTFPYIRIGRTFK